MQRKISYKQTEVGLIPEDWEVDSLGNRAGIIMGQSPESQYYNQNGEGLLFMQGVRTFGEKYPSFDTWTNKVTKHAPANSVLISVRAPVGDLNVTPNDMCIGRGLAAINAKNGNNEYIYQLLKAYKNKVIGQETGTVYGSISRDDIFNLELPFASEKEQHKIVEVLGTLDEKIELNRKMNKTLEQIGHAIFKRWFVDFEFPNAEGKPYKSSGGKLIDSELGEIPEGWERKKIGDFANIDRGISYKGKYLSTEGVPMLNLGSFNLDGSLKLDTLKHYTGDFRPSNTVKAGDIVIANTDMTQNRTILGSACIVPDVFGSNEVLFTHHVYGLRIRDDVPSNYLYGVLKNDDFKNNAINYATGTTVLFLPKEAILDYQIALPPSKILNKYRELFVCFIKKQEINNSENKTLSQIRDSLLPRLMSGKLRIG